MTRQINSWKLAWESLAKGVPAILLYVLESKGSSPGRQGFFMVVNKDGEMSGSIGGGIMEHKFVEMAKAWMNENATSPQVYKQVHDKKSRHQSGMICSGEQEIFLYPFKQQDHKLLQEIISSLHENKNGCLEITPGGLHFTQEIPGSNYSFQKTSETTFRYTEKTGYKQNLHIIGGGHCAKALSKIMRDMDFYIYVYDDRPGLKTMVENSFAHEKHVVPGYDDVSIEPSDENYIVIMTFGYRSDDVALRALMHKNYRYIGLLGSKKKIEKMFAEYEQEGADKNWLSKIYAPIGVAIKSETPEEIAVSIAAEIIRVKNTGQ